MLVSSPDAIRSSVDLPQPDGPTMVTNSPGLTDRLTSSTACVPSGKTIETWSKRRASSAMERPGAPSTEAVSGPSSSTPGVTAVPPSADDTRRAVSDSDLMLLRL